jgi:hypothetical protein
VAHPENASDDGEVRLSQKGLEETAIYIYIYKYLAFSEGDITYSE